MTKRTWGFMEQQILEATYVPRMIGACLALAAAIAMAIVFSVGSAHGAELRLREVQATESNSAHTNPAVEPAGPAIGAPGGVPVQYFGVESCGVKVFWLVMESGKMFRLDADHHPKDYEGFMKSIAGLPHDLVTIPCPDIL